MDRRQLAKSLAIALTLGVSCDPSGGEFDVTVSGVGYYNYESPHASPIALTPDNTFAYVVNTPANTVDVLDTESFAIVDRINVGIDPVSIAVRPDGKEVWVSNHVSDSVSVIDADPNSNTRHQILHTIQQFNRNKATTFDEPVGIAFAGNSKAYVALSSSNRIAVINVRARSISRYIRITAQDPRAIVVRDDRLYVVPFESNNQTSISGCWEENIDGELCTFDARKHVTEAMDGSDQSVSRGYVADIVRHPDIPDRDLYVYDTRSDALVEIVDTLGTLLYGIAVDSQHRVFIAQAEARNDANGKAGTAGHGMAELENRAFFNRITRVDCEGGCGRSRLIELEPAPPDDPPIEQALATPFGIAVTGDDSTVVATAAASSRLFTLDPNTGELLGFLDVDWIPRGVALLDDADGAPWRAWVHNTLANSISVVDISDPTTLTELSRIDLEDPTEPDLKSGRILFNSAIASSTQTFACASCHPDGHTDQLLWVLDTPLCDPGCDQIQPRLVQDIRGLRGSAPYHWDGIPGDPFGGINTANIERHIKPNCDGEIEETCTRHLIDGSMGSTMCDLDDCKENDEGKPGPLSGAQRDDMAKYLLSVPYPPSPDRPYTNVMSESAIAGIHKFHVEKQCGNCHRLPHWTMTNMGGSGMDVPSWRGANDRWKNAPQNRFFFADRVRNDRSGFPERTGFTDDPDMFQMIVEGSMGFSGALGRQVTLNSRTARLRATTELLDALEKAATSGAIVLRAEGIRFDADTSKVLTLQFDNGAYSDRGEGLANFSRDDLVALATEGDALVTVTARLGYHTTYDHPQPTLRPFELPIRPVFGGGRPAEFPELHVNQPIHIRGEYIQQGAYVLVDGERVGGKVGCESGRLPDCDDDVIFVLLDELPSRAGMHLLQVQNPEGLMSNDLPFHVLDELPRALSQNLISSGGHFESQGNWSANTTNAAVSWDGEASFTIDVPSPQPWNVQLRHSVSLENGVEYSLCYDAKGEDVRHIRTNVHTGPPNYRTLMATRFQAEVGSSVQATGASLSDHYHKYHHRFVSNVTDSSAQLNFDLGQSDIDVTIDNVGLFRGRGCGSP